MSVIIRNQQKYKGVYKSSETAVKESTKMWRMRKIE